MIAYSSVYGNTKKAVEVLAQKLEEKGCPKVSVFDLARDDMAKAVEDAFRYGKLVLATITYNADIFPVHENIHRSSDRKKLSEPYNWFDRKRKLGSECSQGYESRIRKEQKYYLAGYNC